MLKKLYSGYLWAGTSLGPLIQVSFVLAIVLREIIDTDKESSDD
jgi:hypothetical protein